MDTKRINQKIIEITPSESLAEMAEKSKVQILTEKFLVSKYRMAMTLIRALRTRQEETRIFLAAVGTIPLGFLAYFFVPQDVFDYLVENELRGKSTVSLIIGCMLSNAMFLGQGGRRAFFFIPLAFLFCFRIVPDSFYGYLLGNEMNERLFFSLGCAYSLPPMAYVLECALSSLYRSMRGVPLMRSFLRDPYVKELDKHLQRALDEAHAAKVGDIEALIKDWAPEYTHLLSQLRDPEVTMQDFVPVVKDVTISQGMACPMYIGGTQEGKPVYVDLNDSPHMLVAGTTGGGKSNFVEHYICTLLDRGNAQLYIIDPSDDLYGYASNPNVTYITQVRRATEVVEGIVEELHNRSHMFKQKKGVRKISDWTSGDAPKRIFIIFDEFASFSEDRHLVKKLISIVRLGRKYGIHVLLATQSPRAGVFPGEIKDNINTRLGFRAATVAHASVLGEPLARSIKEGQKGLAVFQGDFVQTPLNDNRRWWDENVPQEDETFVEEEAKEEPTFVPSNKEEEGSEFLEKHQLRNLLGGEPAHFGFFLTKPRIDGKQKRGYYVKRK